MVRLKFETFGELEVDGKIYYSDMIVWWDGEVEFVAKDHILDMEDFLMLMRKKPNFVVIGTGQRGMVIVPQELRELMKGRKTKLFEDKSDKAVDIFNTFARTGKKVVAYIHTTS